MSFVGRLARPAVRLSSHTYFPAFRACVLSRRSLPRSVQRHVSSGAGQAPPLGTLSEILEPIGEVEGEDPEGQDLLAEREDLAKKKEQEISDEDGVEDEPSAEAIRNTLPPSPSFYTGHASFYDQLDSLQDTLRRARSTLKRLHLDPLPRFALDSVEFTAPSWSSRDEFSQFVGVRKLKSKFYRQLLNALNELHRVRTIATAAGAHDVSTMVDEVLLPFQGQAGNKSDAISRRKVSKPDEFGRIQVRGRRKTSHARVWMLPSREALSGASSISVEQTMGLPSQPGTLSSSAATDIPVVTSGIIVNNMSLAQFFQCSADRERVMRPLKVAGVLGRYNVFAIVRGGGMTGQSGALAHGVAKALVAFDPDLQLMFRRAKIDFRDPRMVERKKTNLLKARAKRAWVKR